MRVHDVDQGCTVLRPVEILVKLIAHFILHVDASVHICCTISLLSRIGILNFAIIDLDLTQGQMSVVILWQVVYRSIHIIDAAGTGLVVICSRICHVLITVIDLLRLVL